jgi:hypothetical protein
VKTYEFLLSSPEFSDASNSINLLDAHGGSTSHGSGTSRFIVRVREGGMLEKRAKGPAVKLPSGVKESYTTQRI